MIFLINDSSKGEVLTKNLIQNSFKSVFGKVQSSNYPSPEKTLHVSIEPELDVP
jgi:hypothetical protein